jgi:hypothetical protein
MKSKKFFKKFNQYFKIFFIRNKFKLNEIK